MARCSSKLLLTAGLLIAPLTATPAADGAAAPAGTERGDGPGTYFLFRTYPSAGDPIPAHVRACDEHFGERASTVVLRQHAQQYVPRVDRASGMAVDEDASHVGPGYVCVAPAANPDFNEGFAVTELPAARADVAGSCRADLTEIIRLAPFIACRFAAGPVPSLDSPGGYTIGNSVAGSIFVAYLVRDPSQPLPHKPPATDPGHTTLPNDPDFYLWRAFRSTNPPSTPDCQQAGALMPSAIRTSALSATQPDPQTAVLDRDEERVRIGRITVCFTGSEGSTHRTAALVQLPRAGKTVTARAFGECRDAPTPAGAHLLMQTCSLGVQQADSPLFRAGQLTSIGLVRRDNPAIAHNVHVWTLGILDGETADG